MHCFFFNFFPKPNPYCFIFFVQLFQEHIYYRLFYHDNSWIISLKKLKKKNNVKSFHDRMQTWNFANLLTLITANYVLILFSFYVLTFIFFPLIQMMWSIDNVILMSVANPFPRENHVTDVQGSIFKRYRPIWIHHEFPWPT